MPDEPLSVLVVEDDAGLQQYLALGLRYEGFEVRAAASSGEAVTQFDARRPDLVILDLGLPGPDGYAVLRHVRTSPQAQVPVVMLTARDGVGDRIEGLSAGADDYLVKPFDFGELVARVRAVLRRTRPDAGRELHYGDLTLDLHLREGRRVGRPLDLTPRAFDVLAAFVRLPERALSKEFLLDTVWGADFLGDDNIVEVYVRQLRRALGEPELIHTVRGAGYALRRR